MKLLYFSLLILVPSFLYSQNPEAERWRVSDDNKRLLISEGQDTTYITSSTKIKRRLKERKVDHGKKIYTMSYNRKQKQTNWLHKGDTLATVESKRGQKNRLFTFADADVIIRPKVCEQVSGQELVVFGQRKRNQRFIKIRFKEADLYGSAKEN